MFFYRTLSVIEAYRGLDRVIILSTFPHSHTVSLLVLVIHTSYITHTLHVTTVKLKMVAAAVAAVQLATHQVAVPAVTHQVAVPVVTHQVAVLVLLVLPAEGAVAQLQAVPAEEVSVPPLAVVAVAAAAAVARQVQR